MQLLVGIVAFENQVKTHIDGGNPRYPFRKDWHNLALSFRNIIADSRPELVMPPISGGSDSSPESPTPKGKKRPVTISVDSDSDDTSFAEPVSRRPVARAASVVGRPFARRFSLRQIHSIIEEGHVCLPQQIDTRVTERMIIMSLEMWEKPLNQFLHRTETLCHVMLTQQISQTFHRWQSTQLYARVVEICESFLKEKMVSQRQTAKRVLQLELQFPMTLSDEALQVSCEKARAEVHTERRCYLAGIYVDRVQMGRTNGKFSASLSREEKIARVTDEQLPPDQYSKEIWLMGVSSSTPISDHFPTPPFLSQRARHELTTPPSEDSTRLLRLRLLPLHRRNLPRNPRRAVPRLPQRPRSLHQRQNRHHGSRCGPTLRRLARSRCRESGKEGQTQKEERVTDGGGEVIGAADDGGSTRRRGNGD